VGDLETVNEMFMSRNKGKLGKDYDMLDCSALIFPVYDSDGLIEDVFLGHTTWRAYYAMLRIWKVYNFHYLPQKVVSFSSSPGLLHSKDDFYVTQGLVVMETTNDVSNATLTEWLYQNVKSSVLSWQRAMVATGFAADGRSWTELFSTYNSGTYNSQWMVFDTSKVFADPSGHLDISSPDLLWIAEQIPSLVATGDVSMELSTKGYWPSYNVPYFPQIYDVSGYPTDRNSLNGYDGSPRTQIFERETRWIESMSEFQDLMRFNQFQIDPVCRGYPANGACAISSRMDLSRTAPKPFGGIDGKVVSVQDILKANLKFPFEVPEAYAQSGPTYDDQETFYWTRFPFVAHRGIPMKMKFGWENFPNKEVNNTLLQFA